MIDLVNRVDIETLNYAVDMLARCAARSYSSDGDAVLSAAAMATLVRLVTLANELMRIPVAAPAQDREVDALE